MAIPNICSILPAFLTRYFATFSEKKNNKKNADTFWVPYPFLVSVVNSGREQAFLEDVTLTGVGSVGPRSTQAPAARGSPQQPGRRLQRRSQARAQPRGPACHSTLPSGSARRRKGDASTSGAVASPTQGGEGGRRPPRFHAAALPLPLLPGGEKPLFWRLFCCLF